MSKGVIIALSKREGQKEKVISKGSPGVPVGPSSAKKNQLSKMWSLVKYNGEQSGKKKESVEIEFGSCDARLLE